MPSLDHAVADAILQNTSLLPPLTEEAPDLPHTINITSCQELIAAAQESAGKPVFVFPSSVTVYGLARGGEPPPIHSDPVQPTDNYTRHKVTTEKALS